MAMAFNTDLNREKALQLLQKATGKELNLQENFVHNYWQNKNKSSSVATVLFEMDRHESWTRGRTAEVSTMLSTLAQTLSNMNINDEAFLTDVQVERLLTVLAYLNSSYAFRVINWLDENRNAVMTKIIATALEKTMSEMDNNTFHTPESLLVERMYTLHIMGMVHEIFNPKITNSIKKTLAEFEDKERQKGNEKGTEK